MNEELKSNLLNTQTYKRLAYMVLFVIIYGLAELLIYAFAIFQILHLLFTGSVHQELKKFALALSAYVYDILKYLGFDNEEPPFPFQEWHYTPKDEEAEAEPKKPVVREEDEIHA